MNLARFTTVLTTRFLGLRLYRRPSLDIFPELTNHVFHVGMRSVQMIVRMVVRRYPRCIKRDHILARGNITLKITRGLPSRAPRIQHACNRILIIVIISRNIIVIVIVCRLLTVLLQQSIVLIALAHFFFLVLRIQDQSRL